MTKRYFMPGLLALSAAGSAMIASFEGTGPTVEQDGTVQAVAYPDPALGWQLPTICNGRTSGVFRGQRASLEKCEAWLVEDASAAGRAIARCTPVPMTQQQYDALVSLTYNIGSAAYCRSTLARDLNAGRCHAAGRQILRWDRSGGRVLAGLTARRVAESRKFTADCNGGS